MDEYVGCKLEHDYYNTTLEFTQPVILNILEDEFDVPGGKTLKITAPDGCTLIKGKPDEAMSDKYQKVYRFVFGKLLQLVKWSRPIFFK